MATPFIYCFIRKDLPKVQQIIQMSHACYESAVANTIRDYQTGIELTPCICLFEVSDELELLRVTEYLRDNEIRYSCFEEPDFGHEYTAICTEIIRTDQKRTLFRNFKLYRD